MKKKTTIRNIASLERELYRLNLEAKDLEHKLDRNLDHLQENYWSMTMNSFFCTTGEKENGHNGFWKSILKNKDLGSAMNSIAGNIASKAAGELNEWLNKFFHKKEN